MSDSRIKFKYQAGIVTGNYAFSINSNTITLSGYVEKLENARIREAMEFEAMAARSYYVNEVNRLKASGERVSKYHIKCDATIKAQEQAKAHYADVWSEVETTYKNPPLMSVSTLTENAESNKLNLFRIQGVPFYVAVVGSGNLPSNLKQLIETIEAYTGK